MRRKRTEGRSGSWIGSGDEISVSNELNNGESSTTVIAGRKLTSRRGRGVKTSSHRPITPWLNRNRRPNNPRRPRKSKSSVSFAKKPVFSHIRNKQTVAIQTGVHLYQYRAHGWRRFSNKLFRRVSQLSPVGNRGDLGNIAVSTRRGGRNHVFPPSPTCYFARKPVSHRVNNSDFNNHPRKLLHLIISNTCCRKSLPIT